jgi:hypothetical protein
VHQACTASGGLEGGLGIGGLFILVVLNLYRTRLRIDYLQGLKGVTLLPCLIRTYGPNATEKCADLLADFSCCSFGRYRGLDKVL